MPTVAINRCRKGTLLSPAGLYEYVRLKYPDGAPEGFSAEQIARDDAVLIEVLKSNPKAMAGHCAHIAFVTVPDNFPWKVMRDGNREWVAADIKK